MKIGITERGDAGLDLSWLDAVRSGKVAGCIAITKAPQLLLDQDIPLNVIIHCTITGLGGSAWEKNVVAPAVSLDAYHKLLDRYGSGNVVLRIDPIFPGFKFNEVLEVASQAKGRVRISFGDLYPHVLNRLAEAGITPPYKTFHAPLVDRLETYESVKKASRVEPEICAEPGFKCSGCVSAIDLLYMGIGASGTAGGRQRKDCCCLAQKTELLKNKERCPNDCLYCYWK